jgi:hypothetical protein
LQPLSAPLPVFATYTRATGTLAVDFDKLLVTGTSAGSNYFAWDGLFRHGAAAGLATVLMRRVELIMPDAVPDFGLVRCTYTAGFPDLIGRNGIAVAPFLGFPLTVI